MTITQELDKRGVEYEVDDSGCMLRIVTPEHNLGLMLRFNHVEPSYYFGDVDRFLLSPLHRFTTLDEMFARFDKLILIYHNDQSPVLFEWHTRNWQPIEI